MPKRKDDFAVQVGMRIRESRKQIGWTQAQAARASEMGGKAQFANYERGLATPSVKNLQKIAHALGETVDSLLPEYHKSDTKESA